MRFCKNFHKNHYHIESVVSSNMMKHSLVYSFLELGRRSFIISGQVPIKIDDDLQDENSKLRALISNNFGRRKNDPVKDRKALETYVSLRGYKQGGTGSNQYMQTCQNGTSAKSTLDEIARELNMSTTNLKRALRIERNLTDSMKELLDTGEITKTFASDTIASLSEEEQEEY